MNGISEILHCNRPGATDAITKPVIKFYLLRGGGAVALLDGGSGGRWCLAVAEVVVETVALYIVAF